MDNHRNRRSDRGRRAVREESTSTRFPRWSGLDLLPVPVGHRWRVYLGGPNNWILRSSGGTADQKTVVPTRSYAIESVIRTGTIVPVLAGSLTKTSPSTSGASR